jgi:sigma-B regulation protein RsbU (phosphoserine phosphatase)
MSATSPPLGLAGNDSIKGSEVPWQPGSDLLVLVSDGIIDARNSAGERFGEARLLELIERHRVDSPGRIVDAVFASVAAYAPSATDDRTLVVLHG